MKRIILFILALSITTFCFAQSNYTESLTITTYYPAPYGVYRNLKLSPTDVAPSGTALTPGVIFFNNSSDTIMYYNKKKEWVNITEGGGASPGEPGDPLVNSAHTQSDCTKAGGNVTDSDVGLKLCQFNAGGCPGGWSQYKSWSTYSPVTCQPGKWGSQDPITLNPEPYGCYSPGCPCCTATGHPWSDSTVTGDCNYCDICRSGDCWSWTTCSPSITYVGCY